MAVRIETKQIPAKTVETTVVTVPAKEWRSAKIKSIILGTTGIAMFLGFFFGMMLFDSVGWAKYFGFDMLHNDRDAFKWIALLFLATAPILFLAYRLIRGADSCEDTLLKKQGWDGKSDYRVELEYPQHFPLD